MSDNAALMQTTARVVAVRDSILRLEADSSANCGGYAMRRFCPSAVMAKSTKQRRLKLPVSDRVIAAPGTAWLSAPPAPA